MPIRVQAIGTDFSRNLRTWSRNLAALRQNDLLSESAFLSFVRDRGLGVSGVLKGEPGILHGRGLLSADGRSGQDLLFHPFRLHVMERSLSVGDHITLARAKEWNSTAELAILLEPIYWPEIIGHVRYNLGERDHSARLTNHRRKAMRLVRSLDPDVWQKIHEALRIDAAWMDPNRELYILLRLSLWEQREALRGRIAGALWIRHTAEVIRRGFEEAHDTHWPEEDRAFGHWILGARLRLFGAERPYDDPLRSKTFVAYHFGLFTGSALRWYVEGETEYYAISHALQQPSKLGVELVNLRGEIASEKRNAARKLEDALKEDLALRRLSVISFDRDLDPNVRAIRRQVEQGHVVGLIEANEPDFEFANFSLQELIEIAALMDDRERLNGNMIRQADWQGVDNGRAFADRYTRVSEKHSSPKGKAWGEVLAAYALEHPVDPRTGAERPFLRMVSAAFWAWHSNYELQKDHFEIDPRTFESKPRSNRDRS
jgi:hypothetical protein